MKVARQHLRDIVEVIEERKKYKKLIGSSNFPAFNGIHLLISIISS